jgi:hypothetical protein
LKNKTGTPVRGADFLVRRAEIQQLWHLGIRGHVLLLAPRRVGKTSLLFHLIDHPLPGWRCLFYSVEALKTEAQFVARLLRTMCEAHPGGAWLARFTVGLQQFLQGVGQVEAGPVEYNLTQALHNDWRDVGATALKVMRELHGNTLVLVDEFPTFIQNLLQDPEDGRRRAKLFLDWFREARNLPGPSGTTTHFVLTGSLSLEAVVRAVSMTSTINDLSVFRLGPLSDDLSVSLLDGLSTGEEMSLPEPVKQKILERIDWRIPFHIQLLFGEVLTRVKFRDRMLAPSLVDEAYEALLAPENYKHFSHWVERFEEPLLMPQERDLKKALLRAACRDRKGISISTGLQIQRKVAPDLDVNAAFLSLDHDGYLTMRQGLTTHQGRWLFASSLLRDWWSKWQMKQKT